MRTTIPSDKPRHKKKDDPSSTLTISEEARGRLDNHSLGRSSADPTAEWANFESADLLLTRFGRV